jgi:hypothetical protein
LLVKKTIEKLTQHHQLFANSKPFFLLHAMQLVHGPIEPPNWYSSKYKNKSCASQKRLPLDKILGMIWVMDEAIGNISRYLREELPSMYENTIFVWASDNGGYTHWVTSNWPFKGGKTDINEGKRYSYIKSTLFLFFLFAYTIHILNRRWYSSISRNENSKEIIKYG